MARSSRDSGAAPKVVLIAVAVSVAGLIVAGVFALTGRGETSSTSVDTTTPSSTSSPSSPDPDSSEDEDAMTTPAPLSTTVLPDAKGGQEAIDALGDKIDFVAQRNGKTVDELKDLLLSDATVRVSTSGDIFFRDDFGGANP